MKVYAVSAHRPRPVWSPTPNRSDCRHNPSFRLPSVPSEVLVSGKRTGYRRAQPVTSLKHTGNFQWPLCFERDDEALP